MRLGKFAVLALWGCSAGMTSVQADDVRYYQENGVTYRETARTVRRPVTETRVEERQETVYREQASVSTREMQRVVSVPVTEYRWETKVYNRWNPFLAPSVGYQLVPRTYWEPRSETVRYPMTQRDLVPETRIVRTPVTTLRFAEQQEVSRVAVTPLPGVPQAFAGPVVVPPVAPAPAPTVAGRTPLGGISRIQSDPPRYGTSLSPDSAVIRR